MVDRALWGIEALVIFGKEAMGTWDVMNRVNSLLILTVRLGG